MSSPETENDRNMALGTDEVHLWSAPLDVRADKLAALSRVLDREERDRALRFRFELDRVRWTAARGWLRHLLASYLGTEPAEVRFSQCSPGKPRLAARSHWLRFNVSHSADMVAIAVAHSREVGIDLESTRGGGSAEVVPLRFLSEREQAALVRLSGQARRRTSLQFWTGKEAYLKAVGLGLRGPVAEIDVALPLEHRIGVIAEPHVGIPGDWSLHTFDAGPDYVGAVVVQGLRARVPAAARSLQLADENPR